MALLAAIICIIALSQGHICLAVAFFVLAALSTD